MSIGIDSATVGALPRGGSGATGVGQWVGSLVVTTAPLNTLRGPQNTHPENDSNPRDMNPTLDVLFRVIGTEVSTDHGYALFSALSRVLETGNDRWMHGNPHIGLHTIRGVNLGNGKRLIDPNARIGLRLTSDLLPRSLKLAGKSIDLDGCKLRIGISQTRALSPATTLHCRIVTTRNGHQPARFDAEISRQSAALGIHGKVYRSPQNAGRSDGRDPSRRIFRVRDKRIVGYSMLATELTAKESIRLQEHGLGGRRRMGCGVFVPAGDANT